MALRFGLTGMPYGSFRLKVRSATGIVTGGSGGGGGGGGVVGIVCETYHGAIPTAAGGDGGFRGGGPQPGEFGLDGGVGYVTVYEVLSRGLRH